MSPINRRKSRSFLTVTTVRYHIKVSDKRTTISLDKIISDLIAIKLGVDPSSEEAHSAVREQLEAILRPFYDPNRYCKPTHFMTKKAILWLVDKKLSDKYEDYLIEDKV
ncbi:MAG: hypothetical protein ABI597_13120 [Gammaproteobacteria bacterium]